MRKLKTLFALLVLSFFTIGNLWATEPETVEVTIYASSGDYYAKTNSWSNGTAYEQVVLDGNITANLIGSGNNGKFYSDWRFYTTGSTNGSFSIDAANGATLSSVTFTYTTSNSGALYMGNTKLTSGTAQSISGTQVVFTCKNTNSSTNGQVRLTKISVTYTPAGGGDPGKTDVTDQQLSWSAASATVALGETPYSLPSLTNSLELVVTYESTDPTVATISNLGAVSVLKAGSTTIKAIYAGSETLNAKTVSYTLTVNKPAPAPIAGSVVDKLTSATFVSTGSYTAFSGKQAANTGHSDAVYAGKTARNGTSVQYNIQMNTIGTGDSQGREIATTTSGGTAKRVHVIWATKSTNTAGRKLTVYGSNTAYSGTETATSGTKIGDLEYAAGDSYEYLDIADSYKYIQIVASDNAIYMDSIIVTWIPPTYTISFNANGGSGEMSSIEGLAKNASQTLPANTFERTGYTFQGWATSAQGAKVYNNQATISNITADINLYAVWEANTTLITLNGNGEGASDGVAQIDYDNTTLDDLTHAIWAAHDLQGYFTAATEGTKIINANGTLVSGVANYTSNEGKWIYTADDELELFAQWTAITNYSITTNLTGCTADAGNPEKFAAASASITLNFDLAEERTWTGATVSVTMGGNAIDDFVFTDGELYIEPAGGFTGNIAVTITAPEIKYDAIIGVNGIDYGTAVFVVAEEELDAVSVPKSATTSIKATANAGYRFVNWTSDENVTFGNATAASTTVSAVSEDAAIVANFEVIPAATLTLSENGSSHNLAGAHLQGDVVTLPTAVQEGNGVAGKVLVGWTDEANKEYAHDTDAPSVFYGKGTNFTLANTTQTLYAVYATEIKEDISYTKLTSQSFDASATYVIGATQTSTDNTMWYFYSCSETDENVSWGVLTSDPENNELIELKLSGTASSLVVREISGDKRYLEGLTTGKFKMSSTSTAVALDDDGTIKNNSTGSYKLRHNYNSGNGGLRWYNSSTGTLAYFYKVVRAYKKYATTGTKAPSITVDESVELSYGGVEDGSIAVAYANVDLANVKVATYRNADCTDTLDNSWLVARLNETKQIVYDVTANPSYTTDSTAYILLTAPSPADGVAPATAKITVTQAANPSRTFASFDALVASDLPRTEAGTAISISFTNVQIQSISNKSVYLKINDAVSTSKYIQIYNKDGNAPTGWAADGYLSTTAAISGTWKLFSDAMELYVELGTSWTGLSYTNEKTAFDNIESDVKAVKVLKDGQIFIIRGEKVYTIQGQLVK